MSDKQITVTFSEEKYKVLDFFLKRENQSIEAILLEQLEKAYARAVPKQTRDYVNFQMTGELTANEETEEPGQETAARRSGERTPRKYNKRRGQETSDAAQTESVTPDAVVENGPDTEQEEGGMQIGM